MTICVIGAGASGLAAAHRLVSAGHEVVVIEARDRIGGRIWTLRPDALAVPVELGAEFLHGDAPEIHNVARAAGLRTADVAGRRWSARRGRLTLMDDFWERLDRPMRRLDEHRTPDRSFRDAVDRMRSVKAADRRLAIQYVEGFHAADPDLISERSLAEGGSPRNDVRERRIGRVLEGYDSVIRALSAPVLGSIRLGCIATRVRWSKRGAEIDLSSTSGDPLEPIAVRAVIVTVPLGVLQALPGAIGALAFDPPVPALERSIAGLVMGAVMRVALQVDLPFWTEERFAKHAGDDRVDTMSFLHARERVPFPVWWTPYPVRAPLLVGWQGGPDALDLARLSRDEVIDAAIGSLARALGLQRRAIIRRVVAAFTHDWISDPFSRGAYSYVGVGGDRASAALARPVSRSLYFAGEHADREGRNGTVHGAIASGWRAADAVIRSA